MRETNIDPQNIEEMYIKYYATLKRYCIRLVSYNPRYTAIADDCVQEAFYRAIRNSKDFTSSKNQYGWLATLLFALYAVAHQARQAKGSDYW